jgi:hypothetical protein
MSRAAVADAETGANVYIETRTVRPGLPRERGKINATIAVIALVIDNDNDQHKAAHLNGAVPSATVETSPGNAHHWLLLRPALSVAEAVSLGMALRKAVRADADTGVITQPYRVAGTPNYPDAKKAARGRTIVPTRIVEITGKTWTASELAAAFPAPAAAPIKPAKPHAKSLHKSRKTVEAKAACTALRRWTAARNFNLPWQQPHARA